MIKQRGLTITYRTCRIDVLKDAAIERVPDFGILRQPFVASLEGQKGQPPTVWEVVAWAKAHDKHIHYIDNCSIEVELSAEELTRFIRDIHGTDQTVQDLTARLNPSDRYVLAAEEF